VKLRHRLAMIASAIVLLASMVEYALLTTSPATPVATGGTIIVQN
jgi:hypothetical protein